MLDAEKLKGPWIPSLTAAPFSSGLVICSDGGEDKYPLVNIQKTMENHHF